MFILQSESSSIWMIYVLLLSYLCVCKESTTITTTFLTTHPTPNPPVCAPTQESCSPFLPHTTVPNTPNPPVDTVKCPISVECVTTPSAFAPRLPSKNLSPEAQNVIPSALLVMVRLLKKKQNTPPLLVTVFGEKGSLKKCTRTSGV